MLKPILARLILLCSFAGSAGPLAAQVTPSSLIPQADPAMMAAIAANSQRTMKPASYALSHKSELALTPQQVEQIDLLARAEEDSATVRSIGLVARMARLMAKRQADDTQQSGWSGPINESQLRDDACEQSRLAAEVMLNLYRDRQAVGKFLTGKQVNLLKGLEVDDVMRITRAHRP